MKQAACPHPIFSGRTPPELKLSLAILVQDQWIYVSIAALQFTFQSLSLLQLGRELAMIMKFNFW